MRAKHQILHLEVRVAFEARSGRHIRHDHPILVNDPARGLLATALTRLVSFARRLGPRRLLHAAWFEGRPGRHGLQAGDFPTLRGNNGLQFRHLRQQRDHQRLQLDCRQVLKIGGR